jgi:8-oxo-dGTP diphosphatase
MTRPRSSEQSLYRFCPQCATPLERSQRHGATRAVCPACGWVQFRNPVVGVAAVIEETDVAALLGAEAIRDAVGAAIDPRQRRVLMARRANSFRGLYCIPCGYVEFDEEIREAIVRETEEETGLVIEPREIIAVQSNFHDPDRQSVGIWFRAIPVGGQLRPGDDTDELLFVSPAAPGVPLAFPTDAEVRARLARDAREPRRSD